MSDTGYVQMANVFNCLREPMLRSAIQALQLPSGSQGLDAGCGIGLQALLLAESVGPAGHATGLDLSPEFLAHAKDIVREAGLPERVSFRGETFASFPSMMTPLIGHGVWLAWDTRPLSPCHW